MPAAINEFMDGLGRVDINAWRHDICGRLLQDASDGYEGFSTRGLCMIYFGYLDLEKILWMGDQMAAVRQMMMYRPIPAFLVSHQRKWYLVPAEDQEKARGFVVDRAKRFYRSGDRLGRYSEIAQETYALPAGDPLLEAIDEMRPALAQIRETLELPEGRDDGGE